MHTKVWLENLKGRVISEDLGVHGRVLREVWVGAWIRFIWLRIWTIGRLL
jgi:hypothetical protein